MSEQYIQIPTLGLLHFCIKKRNVIDDLRRNGFISNLSELQVVAEIDWTSVYNGDDTSRSFILLTDIDDWSYLIWSHWNFKANYELAKDLSEKLNTKVNCYFVDSNIATSRWIFCESGNVSRAYHESHGCILNDEGFCEIECELRLQTKAVFVEDIFWDLYQRTTVSLESINSQKRKDVGLYTGTLV